MEYVYHACKEKGLKEITPKYDSFQNASVFASKNPCISLIFAVNSFGDLDFDIQFKNDMLIFTERRNIFDKLFNCDCYLYKLNRKEFNNNKIGYDDDCVKHSPVKVISEEYVPNILNKLYSFEKEGFIKIYRYPSRPFNIPKDDSDLIRRYVEYESKGHKDAISLLISVHPELKERVLDYKNNIVGD